MSKISELTDGGSLLPTDFLIAVRSGGNVKVQADDITVDQVNLGDNEFIRLGNAQDLTLVHDASNSIINQAGTGNLLIQKAGSTKLTINASGIDVTGSVTASGEVFIAEKLTHTGDTDTHFKFAGADDIRIVAGNVEHAAFDGTIVFNQSGSSTMDFRVESDTSDHMLFVDSSLNRVGIANNAPASTLDVTGTVTADGLTNNGDVVFSKSTTGVPIIKMSGFANANSPYGIINFYNEDGSQQGPNNAVQIKALAKNSDGSGGELAFHTSTGTGSEGADAVERLRIDANGNVGIGTSSVSSVLSVKSDVSNDVNNGILFEAADSTNKLLQLYENSVGECYMGFYQANVQTALIRTNGNSYFNGGNVGIGTNSPTQELEVKAASIPTFKLNQADTYGAEIALRGNDLDIAGSANAIVFYTGGNNDVSTTEAARINASGNLLVGKTADDATTDGIQARGIGAISIARSSVAGDALLILNKKTNDGTIAEFRRDGTTTVGSIGSYNGADLYIGDGEAGVKFSNDNNNIIPWNTSANASRDNNTDLGGTSDRFRNLYLSGGAYLGGTGASNKLEDYEEGTWSVTSGIGLSITFAVYTKIGRVVHLVADITFSSGSTSGTDAALSLPFNNANTYSSGSLNYTTYSGTPSINIEGNFLKFRASVSSGNLSYSNVGGHRFIFHATYFAA